MTNALATTKPAAANIATNQMVMDAATMDSVMRIAEMMASGRSTVPQHLQKSPADCMAVVMQAMQWGMNPFAVAQKTHLVNGHLGYEAQLVNAVVQASGSIDGRFHYEYKGTPGSIECRVGAVLRGEGEITWGEWLNENKVTTKNSPLWKVNPRQQLAYLQTKNWARLYCPGAILGVYSPDELESYATQPRDMGEAQVVAPQATQPAAPGVLEAAQNAATEGVATYAAFWKAASADTRKAIGKDEHNRLKGMAIAADAARTLDNNPAPDTESAAPAKTFAEVMQLIASAENFDQLYVAGAWIETISNDEEKELLNSKFDERKQELHGVEE